MASKKLMGLSNSRLSACYFVDKSDGSFYICDILDGDYATAVIFAHGTFEAACRDSGKYFAEKFTFVVGTFAIDKEKSLKPLLWGYMGSNPCIPIGHQLMLPSY